MSDYSDDLEISTLQIASPIIQDKKSSIKIIPKIKHKPSESAIYRAQHDPKKVPPHYADRKAFEEYQSSFNTRTKPSISSPLAKK